MQMEMLTFGRGAPMKQLYWSNRRLKCAALEKLIEAMPAEERQLFTHLHLYGNELEELPGCLASFTNLTQ